MPNRLTWRRPPDSWRRGQRRLRERQIDWHMVAEREGWLEDPPRARRSDTDLASELRCSRSLVSRRRRRFGAREFVENERPPVEELFEGGDIRLRDLVDVAGSRSRARRWLREYVDAGVLVAVGTNERRRWLLVRTKVDGGEET